MSKIRVIHVAPQLDVGGMEKLLVEFARHTDRSAFELQFVSLTTSGKIADEIIALGWPATALFSPQGLRPMTVLKLAKLFRQQKPDVVHAHNTKGIIYAGLARRFSSVGKLVYTRHSQRFGSRPRTDRLFRFAVRSADAIVWVSKDAAMLSEQEGLPPAKISAIWNGIDTDRFAYAGPRPGGPAVFVGRLSPEKDIPNLLQAVALALPQQPDFRLKIAGAGPVMASLHQLASELNLSQAVTFLGNVDDVPALLNTASMSVLSSYTEGISLTLLEAMARGLPTVATRVGGNPEVVLDGQTGLVVPAKNPAALAHAMLTLWRNPTLGKQFGTAGHERVKAEFDIRRMVLAYQTIYQA